jgi:hypothetical protein
MDREEHPGMITYASGTEARDGDHVNLDDSAGVVEQVIDTDERMAAWGLDQPGLMLRCDLHVQVRDDHSSEWVDRIEPDALVFLPAASASWDTLMYLGRAETTDP